MIKQHWIKSKGGWGAILVALLVFLLVVGLTLPTTAQTTPPPIVGRSPSCATLNGRDATFPSVLSDFGFRINDVNGPFDGIYQRIDSGNQNGRPTVLTGGAPADGSQTITISNSTSKAFDWSSTFAVTAVIVKGGTNSNIYVY